MIGRFSGAEGHRRLVDCLARQGAVQNDPVLAGLLADACTLLEFADGESLIEQDGVDNDVFFLLVGAVDVWVNGVRVASRQAGNHVGEMAALDPSVPRSAKVVAQPPGVVAAVVPEAQLTTIASANPKLWRSFAVELVGRLRERGSLLRAPNARSKLFIGSSTEGLAIARAVQEHLEHDPVDASVWTDDVFSPSGSTLADLMRAVQDSDFGLFILTPDDETNSRGTQKSSPRDNVVLELGMFLGLHGPQRAFFMRPRGTDLKIPTDLLGIGAFDYDPSRVGTDPLGALAAATSKLRRIITTRGPR